MKSRLCLKNGAYSELEAFLKEVGPETIANYCSNRVYT